MITEERKKELKEFAKELWWLEVLWQKDKGNKEIEEQIISKTMELNDFKEMNFVDDYINNVLTK